MNAAEAAAKVSKLEALADPTRGGTAAERKAAAGKAKALRERFGLRAQPPPRRQAPPPRRFTGHAQRGHRWAFVTAEVDWKFDPRTGDHSDNVTVEYHRNRGNWKIWVK